MQKDKDLLRKTQFIFLWASSLIYKISLGRLLITPYIISHLDFATFKLSLSLHFNLSST